MTERGVAYLVRVRNKSSATVILVPSSEEVVSVFDLRSASMSSSEITSGVAMPNGCLILGTTDGSLACFQLATTPRKHYLHIDPRFGVGDGERI